MSRPVTSSWWRNVPCSSAAPARSASPSSSSPRSKPPPAIIASASSTLGRIGSGLMPPKYGLRSLWISVTRIRPPASSRGIQPEPAPYSGSTSTDTSAARSASRSIVRRDVRARSPRTGRTTRRAPPPRRRRTAAGRWPARAFAAIPASIAGSMSAPAAAPVGALTLNPLSVHGLWRGGDHDARRGPALDDLVRAHLGRDGGPADRDRDVVGEQDLGRGPREVLRGEPPVVGDDDALRLLARAPRRTRATPSAQRRTFSKREVLGDPGPPAVGPEDDPWSGRGASAGLVTLWASAAAHRSRSACDAAARGPAGAPEQRDRLAPGSSYRPAPPDDEAAAGPRVGPAGRSVADLDRSPGWTTDPALAGRRRPPSSDGPAAEVATSRRRSTPSRPAGRARRPPSRRSRSTRGLIWSYACASSGLARIVGSSRPTSAACSARAPRGSRRRRHRNIPAFQATPA